MYQIDNQDINVYFEPVLPWQQDAWLSLLNRYDKLPHALLFSGMRGIGKRAFVWRFVAWLLCDNRHNNNSYDLDKKIACGQCQSCQWLASGTHPDLKVLPYSSMPNGENTEDAKNSQGKQSKKSKTDNKSKSTPKKPLDQSTKQNIKIDDIRELQPFINQGSNSKRICVIDRADMMTVAASNALLKTLEEPREGVHLFLITDMPAKLLPTIKSRVQKIYLDRIQHDLAIDFILNNLRTEQSNTNQEDEVLNQSAEQALKLANGAPLAALDILSSSWYECRDTWIKAWLALRSGMRSPVAASDYWQKTLSLNEFLQLSECMLMDFSRVSTGLIPLQTDINLNSYPSIEELNFESIQDVFSKIDDTKLACEQNVQEKIAYDNLIYTLAML